MPDPTPPASIDDYIAGFAPQVQSMLQQLRRVIIEAAPGVQQGIGYRIPAFKLNGRVLIYFAAYRNHIGLYPVSADDAGMAHELAAFASGKATLKFALDQPLPLELIAGVVAAKIGQQAARKTSGTRLASARPD
jgi:uncharacterized protein YdhG (YjbR/CyaY superfamily)